jgi:hypothetical protein
MRDYRDSKKDTARLMDGTPAPNRLGDSVSCLRFIRQGLLDQLRQYKDRLPEKVVGDMQRHIRAIECAMPVLLWELNRRKEKQNMDVDAPFTNQDN